MPLLPGRRHLRATRFSPPPLAGGVRFAEDWSLYTDLADVLASSQMVLGSNFGGHQNIWGLEHGGDSSGWQQEAYGLEADATFGKCLRADQWGRDEFASLFDPNPSGSCPTPRLTYALSPVLAHYWSSSLIRFGVASDHFSGVRGWTTLNDGSSAYKIVGDEYSNTFPGTSNNQLRMEIAGGTALNFTPNNGSASESSPPLSSTKRRQSPGTLFNFTHPISTTGNGDAWYQFVRCFIPVATQDVVMGWFARKYAYRDGTLLTAPTMTDPANYADLTEGDWRFVINRYTGANHPAGIQTFGWGLNMNGRIDYSQNLYYGPVTIWDGDQQPDPLGLLAIAGVTP